MIEIIVRPFVDRYTEGINSLAASFKKGLPGVLDGVVSIIAIIIFRFTI